MYINDVVYDEEMANNGRRREEQEEEEETIPLMMKIASSFLVTRSTQKL